MFPQGVSIFLETSPSPQKNDENFDDHIVPIVSCTNVLKDGEAAGENGIENGVETDLETEENRSLSHATEEHEGSMEHEEEHSSAAPPDPEEDQRMASRADPVGPPRP